MDRLHDAMSDFLMSLPPTALSPSTQIRISRDYHLKNHQYLEAAFTEILHEQIGGLLMEDHINLGPHIMARLSPIFEAMTEHRAMLCAYAPPAEHDVVACVGQARKDCKAAWLYWWHTNIAQEGLRNVNQRPWSSQEIVSKLRMTSEIHPWGMSWQCSDKTRKVLRSPPLSGIIFGDNMIIQHAFQSW